jgi:hypothetical protein
MSFPVEANSTYDFEAYLVFQSNNTGYGVGFSINGPVNPVWALHQTMVTQTATANYYLNGFGYNLPNNTSASVVAANTNYLAKMRGTIATGENGGILILRWRGENAAGTYTVVAGSFILYSKVA